MTDLAYIDLVTLVTRCRGGDSLAWDQFDRWFAEKAGRILGHYRLSQAERMDVRASARERVFRAIQRGAIRGETNAEVAAYVATAIKRGALDAVQERHGDEIPDDLADPGPGPEAAAIARLELERAAPIIQSWPAKDRFLFFEKLHGVSASAIRDDLMRQFGENVSAATVDSRFSRLRHSLRAALRDPERRQGSLEESQ